MLIDVVRLSFPQWLRGKLGIWLESKVLKSRLLTFVFYYFLYGIVVRLLSEETVSATFRGTELVMPRESMCVFIEVFRDHVYGKFSRPREGDTVIDVGHMWGCSQYGQRNLLEIKVG